MKYCSCWTTMCTHSKGANTKNCLLLAFVMQVLPFCTACIKNKYKCILLRVSMKAKLLLFLLVPLKLMSLVKLSEWKTQLVVSVKNFEVLLIFYFFENQVDSMNWFLRKMYFKFRKYFMVWLYCEKSYLEIAYLSLAKCALTYKFQWNYQCSFNKN